jgi:hypothetical protein
MNQARLNGFPTVVAAKADWIVIKARFNPRNLDYPWQVELLLPAVPFYGLHELHSWSVPDIFSNPRYDLSRAIYIED